MASRVHLVVNGPACLEAVAVRRLGELERLWSRFIAGSDVDRLNSSPGQPVPVAAETLRLLDAMAEGWRVTDGLYDPTVLAALIAEGYTSSIDDPDRRTVLPDTTTGGGRTDGILVDHATGTAWLPTGTAVDPGGIGKGLAADIVAGELVDGGAGGAVVNVGGDLRVIGQPDGPMWTVAVEDPAQPGTTLLTFAIDAGGVATSSTRTRRWTRGGCERHHLIDPWRGVCADTDLAAATVVAPTAWRAEVEATAVMLLGRDGGLERLADTGLDGVLVGADGCLATTPALGDLVATSP